MTLRGGISWNGEGFYDNSFTIYDLRFGKFARVAWAGRRQAEPAHVRFEEFAFSNAVALDI